jgi:hypothetical protein
MQVEAGKVDLVGDAKGFYDRMMNTLPDFLESSDIKSIPQRLQSSMHKLEAGKLAKAAAEHRKDQETEAAATVMDTVQRDDSKQRDEVMERPEGQCIAERDPLSDVSSVSHSDGTQSEGSAGYRSGPQTNIRGAVKLLERPQAEEVATSSPASKQSSADTISQFKAAGADSQVVDACKHDVVSSAVASDASATSAVQGVAAVEGTGHSAHEDGVKDQKTCHASSCSGTGARARDTQEKGFCEDSGSDGKQHPHDPASGGK